MRIFGLSWFFDVQCIGNLAAAFNYQFFGPTIPPRSPLSKALPTARAAFNVALKVNMRFVVYCGLMALEIPKTLSYLTSIAHGRITLLTRVHFVRRNTEADGAQYVIGGFRGLLRAAFFG